MAHLLDLNDDCLLEVLDRLPPHQLMIVLGVNRRLRRLAIDKLQAKVKMISLCGKRKEFFTGCTHLNSFNLDQVLVLERINLEQVFPLRISIDWWTKFVNTFLNPYQPSRADLLLFVSAKCPNVKSIELGEFRLSNEMLLNVVRQFPKLECIKLADASFDNNNWYLILDAIGHQIVHFTKKSLRVLDYVQPSPALRNDRFLAIVAEKCPNIKRVDWIMSRELTSTLIESIKMLPINCWIACYCTLLSYLIDDHGDVFDELIVDKLNLNSFGHRVDRLSSLEFYTLSSWDVHQLNVEFGNLKKLKVRQITPIASFLLASQFPRLESFQFNARNTVTKDKYEGLFNRIPSVKKLIINIDYNDYLIYNPCLPSFSSIRHLNNLDTIVLNISYVPNCWQPQREFLQQLVQYSEEVVTLKKLIINPGNFIDYRGVKKLLNLFKIEA